MKTKVCKDCGSKHLSYERESLECFENEEQLLKNKHRIKPMYCEITYRIVCDSCGHIEEVKP